MASSDAHHCPFYEMYHRWDFRVETKSSIRCMWLHARSRAVRIRRDRLGEGLESPRPSHCRDENAALCASELFEKRRRHCQRKTLNTGSDVGPLSPIRKSREKSMVAKCKIIGWRVNKFSLSVPLNGFRKSENRSVLCAASNWPPSITSRQKGPETTTGFPKCLRS
jgi:hypothetical protein